MLQASLLTNIHTPHPFLPEVLQLVLLPTAGGQVRTPRRTSRPEAAQLAAVWLWGLALVVTDEQAFCLFKAASKLKTVEKTPK